MKYTNEIVIDLPRKKVIELFDNVDNMSKWMTGLKSFETISGEPGHAGTKSRLVFENKGKKFEMIETIKRNNLPDEMTGSYEMKGVLNFIENRFVDKGEKTLWIADNEFVFSGFMKLVAGFMKGSFQKQSLEFMENFKKFAEEEVSVGSE